VNEVENSSLMVKFKMLSFNMTGFKRLQIAMMARVNIA